MEGTEPEAQGTPNDNPGRRPRGRRRRSEPDRLTNAELQSVVCGYVCEGFKVVEVLKKVRARFPQEKLNRESVYRIWRDAGKKGWLEFHPPLDATLESRLRDAHPWLRGVGVVRTTNVRDVARRAAKAIVSMLQQFKREQQLDEVHIGFAGGHAIRALARALAERLTRFHPDLPKTTVLHALAAGFDLHDPTTNPNTFFTYFTDKAVMQVEVGFVGLSAPAMVGKKELPGLMKMPDIKAAFEQVSAIHIFVTSGTEWRDDHSALKKRMGESRSMDELLAAGASFDLLWRPIGPGGPIEIETDIRALSLIELSALPARIAAGKRVLLMVAPCGRCETPKPALLRCVLEQPRHLITDLVVDTRSVGQMLRVPVKAGPAGH